jgi:hypothetical protein
MWSQVAYSEAPWSGPLIPAAPPGQVLPPNVPPGGTSSYTYGVQQGSYPWSYGGWSGGLAPFASLAGGIIAVPNPATGTVTLSAWWPYAPTLQLVRTAPDGSRVAVRGGYPVTPATATMVNYSTNPNSISTAGYVPGTGSPTLSLINRTDIGGTAVRATNASSGTSEVTVPQSLLANPQITVAFDLQLSAKATSLMVTLGWVDGLGGALSSTAVSLTADQISSCVAQFRRFSFQIVPPAAAATCSTLKVNAGGMPAGGTMDLDRWLVTQASTDGTYGDGDSLGGLWTGTSGLSTSILAPVQTVVDGECPLDVACFYTLYAPFLTGGYARTPTITLASNESSWLTHPATPSSPIQVTPYAAPTLTRKIQQGVFPVIGRQYPVVVSASNRLSPTGTLWFDNPSFTTRDQLLGLLQDGSAVLLRAPADAGYGLGMWLAIGDVVEDPQGRPAWSGSRPLSCAFTVVDTPAGPNTLVA